MPITVRGVQGRAVLVVERALSVDDLPAFRDLVADHAGEGPIVVDCSAASEIEPVALSEAIRVARECGRAIDPRGLRDVHRAILRYLGHPSGQPLPREDPE
jgi:hypothetical protein